MGGFAYKSRNPANVKSPQGSCCVISAYWIIQTYSRAMKLIQAVRLEVHLSIQILV